MKISSNRNLLHALQSGDKITVAKHLSQFKERGVIVFDKVLSIDSSERIPALSSDPEIRHNLLVALVASISSAFSNLNLKNGMNEDQIIELADQIIDQSNQDNLSIEDVLLFLQKLIVGTWKIYERMDIPFFFELFENYRQERYENLLRVRDEMNTQFKILGSETKRLSERSPEEMFKDHEIDGAAMSDLLKTYLDECGSDENK